MYNKKFMNYYTLPKINNKIKIDPKITTSIIKPHISQTLINYYNKLIEEINDLEKIHKNYNDVIKIVNPYQYIFSKVPGSNYSVSKIKTKSIMFYELLEIFQTTNLLDSYKFDVISSLIVGANYEDSLECLEMLRENYNIDKFFCFFDYNSTLHNNCIEKTKFNFIIYELNHYDNINQYMIILIELLIIIINQLKETGTIILKINNLFYQPILEIIYLLNSFFEKTLIVKPNACDIISFDKYIVFQKFKINHHDFDLFHNYNTIFNEFITNYYIMKNKDIEMNIKQIITNDLPYYFLNKIDDINIIIGQQQLESLTQIINILKGKNIEEKIEVLKKNNIQKSVHWCEKFKIPCNKFSDKINLFL
jgi:hypothetical protein